MKKLIGFAVVVALLSFVSFADASVGVKDEDGLTIGAVADIQVSGVSADSYDGNTVTLFSSGHKAGVTTNVSTESNLTSAALAYGVVKVEIGSTRYVALADGADGQMITFIVSVAGGGNFVITNDKVASTNTMATTGWDDITLETVNDCVTLLYLDDTYGWIIVGGNSYTVS